MNTSQIKCFVTVAKTLNFTEAAKSLFMAQPALSKQIALIEHELNMQLFDRTRRYVRLTPQGEVLYEELSNVAHLIDSAIKRARAVENDSCGILTIGVSAEEAILRELPKVVHDFHGCYPSVQLNITVRGPKAVRDGLAEGEFDMVMAMKHELDELQELEMTELVKRRMNFVISKLHPMAGMEHVTLDDLAGEAFISVEEEDGVRLSLFFAQVCRQCGYSPGEILSAPNLKTQRLWAAAGMGVALVDFADAPWLRDCLKIVEIPAEIAHRYVAAWKKDSQNPFIGKFLELLTDNLFSA